MESFRHFISIALTPEQLKQQGPRINGRWSHPNPRLAGREIGGESLLDTGAHGAMIDLGVAEDLVLPVIGTKHIHGIHGNGRLQQYRATLILPTKDSSGAESSVTATFDCIAIPALREENQEQGSNIIGILGRLFLQFASLEIDGVTGAVRLRVVDPVCARAGDSIGKR